MNNAVLLVIGLIVVLVATGGVYAYSTLDETMELKNTTSPTSTPPPESTISHEPTLTSLSTPKLSVRVVDRSYYVAEKTVFDPFTGKSIVKPGYYIENITLDFSVKNQKIEKYEYLYYVIQMKPHFSEDWQSFAYKSMDDSYVTTDFTYCAASNQNWGHKPPNDLNFFESDNYRFSAPYEGMLDLRVKAITEQPVSNYPIDWAVTVGKSDWSNIETITLPECTIPNDPAPTLTIIITP